MGSSPLFPCLSKSSTPDVKTRLLSLPSTRLPSLLSSPLPFSLPAQRGLVVSHEGRTSSPRGTRVHEDQQSPFRDRRDQGRGTRGSDDTSTKSGRTTTRETDGGRTFQEGSRRPRKGERTSGNESRPGRPGRDYRGTGHAPVQRLTSDYDEETTGSGPVGRTGVLGRHDRPVT